MANLTMGLHVKVLYNVKIHTCDTKKAVGEIISYTDGAIYVSSLESCVEESHHHLYSEVVDITYSCECDYEEQKISTIGRGYVSRFLGSEDIKPGELVEYIRGNGFYYGAYSKWYRESRSGAVKLLKHMSDCDGCYVGSFVADLRDELMSADPGSLTEQQQEYRKLLKDVPEQFLKQTLIIHN